MNPQKEDNIVVSVDVTKLDKSKFILGKMGSVYVDLILIPTPNSRYGSEYCVKQNVKDPEQRGDPTSRPIIGNARILKRNDAPPVPAQPSNPIPF